MADKQKIDARKAGRELAAEIIDYINSESDRLRTVHIANYGQESVDVLLETIRDALLQMRPLPVKSSGVKERSEPYVEPKTYDINKIPSRFLLVTFDCFCDHSTTDAVLIGDLWIPKSQLLDIPIVGDKIGDLPVTKWWCNANSITEPE